MAEVGSYADFVIQTRPEIRKGCVWDIGLLFSLEALTKYKLKEIYLEKPRVQRESGAYLCLKVRSKLIQKEIGFGKVGELEPSGPFIEPNVSTGCATLKVKFMQRPRAVFHRHADVMVLVVAIRSCLTNEVLMTAEHELIFRGGTGSMHSAERKKATGPHTGSHHAAHHSAHHPSLPTASSYHHDAAHASHHADTTSHASHHLAYNAGHAHASANGLSSTRLTRSSRPLPAPASLPSFTKPSREHFAISEAVSRAHPQAAALFPHGASTSSQVGPHASAADEPAPASYFLKHSGSFALDPLVGDAGEGEGPHMEVQPLTLEAIHEFQQGLQAHCLAKPTHEAPPATPLKHELFDFPSALSPNTGLTEDSSNTDLDDALELEAWAKSSGLDTALFDPSPDSLPLHLQPLPFSHTSYPSDAQDGSFFPPDASYASSPLPEPSLSSSLQSLPKPPSHTFLSPSTSMTSPQTH